MSKRPPRSGSSLEAVEPHPQKGAIKSVFFKFFSFEISAIFTSNFLQLIHGSKNSILN